MGRVRILLCTLLTVWFPAIGLAQDVIVTIDEHDKKEIIERLEELKVRREQVKMLQAIIERDQQQDQREQELNAKQVALLTQERDLYKEEATRYQKAWEDATRGRSKKCWVAKVFTVGIARCH
jgi:L-fucose isomerase-like protein